MLINDFLREKIKDAGFSNVEISKNPTGTRVTLHVTRPGIVIGRKGSGIKELTEILEKEFNLKNPQIAVEEILKHVNRDLLQFNDFSVDGVKAYAYEMEGFTEQCVETYLELTGANISILTKVATPNIDDHQFDVNLLRGQLVTNPFGLPAGKAAGARRQPQSVIASGHAKTATPQSQSRNRCP